MRVIGRAELLYFFTIVCYRYSREREDISITFTAFKLVIFVKQDTVDCNIIFPNQNNVVYLHQKYFDIHTNTYRYVWIQGI